MLTIKFQEAATQMYSVKNVFWKFQEKFFKNNCDWAYFLQSSRLLACNFTKNALLHKSFQGFLLDYQNTLFREQLFMGHSWQRVTNTCYVIKTPSYRLPIFLKFCPTPLSVASNLHPLLFLSCFFDWMGDRATFNVLFRLMILWIYKCWALVP